MQHKLPDLPYPKHALEPYISAETIEYHYGKHHAGYVEKLNKQIQGTEFETASLEDIIRKARGGIFNNGAQVWNHNFYWQCLRPDSSEAPGGKLAEDINETFGGFSKFKEQFTDKAVGNFGSGWTWLVLNGERELAIVNTDDADNPLRTGMRPLLTCDVWEHAYYIDYRNARKKYIDAFWHLVNWEFVEQNQRVALQEEEASYA